MATPDGQVKRVRPWRRFLRRSAVYVTLGFVSCVLVTWWMALVRPWDPLQRNVFDNREPYANLNRIGFNPYRYSAVSVEHMGSVNRDFVVVVVGSVLYGGDEGRSATRTTQIDREFEEAMRAQLELLGSTNSAVSGVIHRVPRVLTEEGRLQRFTVASWGWPMRCLCTSATRRRQSIAEFDRVPRISSGWVISVDENDYPRLVLPFSPVWPGLFVNVVLYAGVACTAFEIPMLLFRIRRRRALRCTACGYTLKGLPPGSPCPECGFQHATKTTTAAPEKVRSVD